MKLFNIRTIRKIINIVIAILIIVLPLYFLLRPHGVTAAWKDDNWKFRRKLVIDAAQVSDADTADLSNFPVLVNINNDPGLKANAQSDGDDILFTSSDGTTQLDHEIESYNSETGTLIAWVEVTTLDYDNDTTIYMYYGNSTASSQQAATATWNSNYQGVWHLKEDPSGGAPQIQDSTTNNNDGTSAGSMTSSDLVTGKVNGALDFDGSNDNIGLGDPTILDGVTQATFSFWYNRADSPRREFVLTKWATDQTSFQLRLVNASNPDEFDFFVADTLSDSGLNFKRTTAANISPNVWYYISIVYDGTQGTNANRVIFYVNGSTVTSTVSGTIPTSMTSGSTSSLEIADLTSDGTSYNYQGQLDELKISNSARTAGWIATEYNNQSSPGTFFKSVGGEEKRRDPALYWAFDEGQGTSANDSGPARMTGTLNNTPTWQTEDMCIAGKCLYFDGTNNENVSKSDDDKLDFGTGSFSVGAWVKRNGASSANNVILTKSTANLGATYTGYKLYMDSSGDLCFDTQDGTNAVDTACTSAVEFDDNQWHYVSGVKATTTSLTLYVDGKSRATDSSIASTATLSNSSTLYVGVDSDGLATEWLGFIDEVKVYDYARSQAQINADFNSKGGIGGASATLGASSSEALSEGLVGYWKMDESSGNASDSSGNGLTLTNNSAMVYSGGKFGNGAQGDGTADYLSTTTTISSVQTVAFWVYPSSTTDNFINLTSSAYINSSSGVVSATGFTSPSIYVNGVANGTITASAWNHVVVTTSTGINANQFEVGRANNSYLSNTSKMDDVRVYNRTLSPKEVRDLYNFAPGPVGYWKMDEKTGTAANDSSGNGLNGTLTNSPVWDIGKFGSGVSFDGTSSKNINLQNPTQLQLTGAMTVSAWVKIRRFTDESGNSSTGIVTRSGASGSRGWSLRAINSGSKVYFDIATNATTTIGVTSLSSPSTNTWVHLTGIYEPSTALKIYINGILDNSNTTSIPANQYEGALVNTLIGRVSNCCDFDGVIDEVKIYNYARTPKQIVSDMNAGHPAVGSPVGSAVGHWDFDESTGTNANDLTPNNNDLTLSSASWTKSGKFGGAFNGATNLRLSRADDADFDFAASDDFALSVWFKSDSATNPSANEYLVEKGATVGTAAIGYAIYTSSSSDGLICFGIDDDAVTNFPEDSVCSSSDLYDNTWHHIVAAKTSSRLDLYVDGKANGTPDTSISSTGTLENSAIFYLGDANGTDGTDEFLGDLDEVKVYRYALTEDEVKTEYNQGKSLVLGALGSNSSYPSNASNQEYCVPGDTSSCAAPVLRYDLEEKSGQTVNDSSGTGNNGTLGADSSASSDDPTWSTGKIGGALNFDGSDDYVSVGNMNATATTVSFWFKPKTTINSASSTKFPLQLATTNIGILMGSSTGFLANEIIEVRSNGQGGRSGWCSSTDSISIDWHHLAIVFSSNNYEIYLDGVRKDNCTQGTQAAITASSVEIGRFSNFPTSAWDTFIDDVRIFNYARTPAQIAWDYNRGVPIAHWDFDECTGTSLGDLSGNSFTGTWSGATGSNTSAGTCTTVDTATAWYNGVTGKYNSSLDFDGTDDAVTVTDTANIRFDSSSADFSLFTWVKRTTTGTEYIISKEDADNDGYRLLFTSSNTVQCSEDATDVTSTSTITDTNWHHIGCTIDRDGNGQIYIDGKANGSTQAMGTDAMATTAALTLGTRSYTSTSYFNGLVDDVKIFNYALSQSQVNDLYNNGAVRFGPATGNP